MIVHNFIIVTVRLPLMFRLSNWKHNIHKAVLLGSTTSGHPATRGIGQFQLLGSLFYTSLLAVATTITTRGSSDDISASFNTFFSATFFREKKTAFYLLETNGLVPNCLPITILAE